MKITIQTDIDCFECIVTREGTNDFYHQYRDLDNEETPTAFLQRVIAYIVENWEV